MRFRWLIIFFTTQQHYHCSDRKYEMPPFAKNQSPANAIFIQSFLHVYNQCQKYNQVYSTYRPPSTVRTVVGCSVFLSSIVSGNLVTKVLSSIDSKTSPVTEPHNKNTPCSVSYRRNATNHLPGGQWVSKLGNEAKISTLYSLVQL